MKHRPGKRPATTVGDYSLAYEFCIFPENGDVNSPYRLYFSANVKVPRGERRVAIRGNNWGSDPNRFIIVPNKDGSIDRGKANERLERVVEYYRQKGVSVCLLERVKVIANGLISERSEGLC